MAANPELETLEQILPPFSISHGNSRKSTRGTSTQQLGEDFGPQGCVLACSRPSRLSKMFTLQHSGENIQVCIPPIWTLDSSRNMHQVGENSSGISLPQGNYNICVFRSLVDDRLPDNVCTGSGRTDSSASGVVIGVSSESIEISTAPNAGPFLL